MSETGNNIFVQGHFITP